MTNMEFLLNAGLNELKCGFVQDDDNYICLLCGEQVEKGVIYPEGEVLYEAEKYMRIHIEREHGSVFEYLINLDKRFTGLSEHQSKLLGLFYQGKSDEEIQKEAGIGSSATVRNHRFILREKERQAKMFLVLMELLNDKNKQASSSLLSKRTLKDSSAKNDDEKILKKYFPYGIEGPLKAFKMKEKSRIIILKEIAKRFEMNKFYSEKEVNEILEKVYDDFITLRRYLIEYGFMDRKSDGSQYWLKDNVDKMEEKKMDRKRELKLQYKETKTEGGVYQVRNMKNGKVLVESTPNLRTMNGKLMQLQLGGHKNKELQDEWKQFGEEAFEFEVLEVLEEKKDGYFDRAEELKKLEKKWLEKMQPYGEKGYNKLK